MNRKDFHWYSDRLNRTMNIRIYGDPTGMPMLIFPTQNSMSDNFENFGMIGVLNDYIEDSRIQLFCVDTIDAETWSNTCGNKYWRARQQENYYNYIIEEVVPFINGENQTGKLPITAGCSMGGMHAAITFFRRPDLLGGVLALSGVYDAKSFFDGWSNPDLYHNSPVDFLANIDEHHPYIEIYNRRSIILCVGQGAWEDECRRTTAIMGDILAAKHINAWVDFWGYDVNHDWDWWHKQLRYFLPYLLDAVNS